MAFAMKPSPNRPNGRPAKFPNDQVVEMIRQGLSPEEVAALSGLSVTRVKEIRCKAGLGPGRNHNKGNVFKKIAPPPALRPGFMQPEPHRSGECIVRKASPEELAEIERMLKARR